MTPQLLFASARETKKSLPALLLLLILTASSVTGQVPGTCEVGNASDTLDVNNVRATVYNHGGLFWNGSGNVYTIPKDGEANSIFAAGIWVGGLDQNNELRFAGTTYGPFEFYPGPFDLSNNPPSGCEQYDRIYRISRDDLDRYEQSGILIGDIRDWPVDLGAPVTDGDGDPGNYNLSGGDLPELTGDQMAWWVMNDVGGPKGWSQRKPIGLEVQVSAFAVESHEESINNTTFYRYRLENKGAVELRDMYFGMFVDVDLGNAADDYVGSDSVLGLGITYNGDDFDQGFDGYGVDTPAIGFDFVQGPLVDNPVGGMWTDPDGTVHPGMTRRQMDVFFSHPKSRPPEADTDDPYQFLQGLWHDGSPLTVGGDGLGGMTPTRFMFSGDATNREFWSEENTDGLGTRNLPGDKRFVTSTGPFDFPPGEVQEIVVAIIWSRADSRLASFTKLKSDDEIVQIAFDQDALHLPQLQAPVLTAEPLDGTVILEWSNPPTSNNYLERFDERGFVSSRDPANKDLTHTFEGYILYEFENESDSVGQEIAIYDVDNNVRGVVELKVNEETGQREEVVSIIGNDSGIQRSHVIDNLQNYRDYYYGVQAYAVNEYSSRRILRSSVTRASATPAPVDALSGGTVLQAGIGDTLSFSRISGAGSAEELFAIINNPLAVRDATYELRFYSHPVRFHGTDSVQTELTYDIVRLPNDSVVFDGGALLDATGVATPFGENVFSLDGLSLTIVPETPDFEAFLTIANADGLIEPPTGAATDFSGFPVPERPGSSQQQGEGVWFIHTGDSAASRGDYKDFLSRSLPFGFETRPLSDWEIRFTPTCFNAWQTALASGTPFATPPEGCYAYDRFDVFGDKRPQLVPFELWNIGVGTPDDASDDYRMIPAIIDMDGDGFDMQWSDHSVSSADNDPQTDWVYWYHPLDQTPGTAGYDVWKAELLGGVSGNHGEEVFGRMVWVNWNGGSVGAAANKADFLANVVDQQMPEAGTVFRLVTTKPFADGDVFRISTVDVAPLRNIDSTAVSELDNIGISPNPYYGISDYEKGLVDTEVRFTNMPDKATIRVFTLAGSLVRTLEKNDGNSFLSFNLRNEHGNWLSSGMYLIHVEVPGVGERTLKFGLIQRNKALQ